MARIDALVLRTDLIVTTVLIVDAFNGFTAVLIIGWISCKAGQTFTDRRVTTGSANGIPAAKCVLANVHTIRMSPLVGPTAQVVIAFII